MHPWEETALDDQHKFLIINKYWRIRFVKNLKDETGNAVYGLCDNPDTRNRKIQFDETLPQNKEKFANTVLHEVLHAGAFILDEETVKEIANAQTRMLKKLGLLDTK